jgi:hypothetical protein
MPTPKGGIGDSEGNFFKDEFEYVMSQLQENTSGRAAMLLTPSGTFNKQIYKDGPTISDEVADIQRSGRQTEGGLRSLGTAMEESVNKPFEDSEFKGQLGEPDQDLADLFINKDVRPKMLKNMYDTKGLLKVGNF